MCERKGEIGLNCLLIKTNQGYKSPLPFLFNQFYLIYL